MEFIILASAHFLALLSPGPDFFLIMQASLRLNLRYGIAICSGIAFANGVYVFLAVFGFEVIQGTTWLLSLFKYLGAVYLLFIGIMLLRAPKRACDNQVSTSFLHIESIRRQFMIGFMSAILNPKNIIFYFSLFTVMVSSETAFSTRCLYALWMMSVVFVWDCFVVLVISRDKVKKSLGECIFYIEKIAGTALAFFGVVLPFT